MMFSFKNLAVVATLAFGAISAVVAAPSPVPAESTNVLARCGCDSAATIITDVTTSVAVYTQQLRNLGASDCTVDKLTPIVAGIKTEIVAATVKVNALMGEDATIILASVDGTAQIGVSVLAGLVVTLLTDIFGAFGVVLKVNGLVAVDAIITLFASVGEIVGCFVCCLLSVTASVAVGLSAAITAGLGSNIIAVVGQLQVAMISVALGIKL